MKSTGYFTTFKELVRNARADSGLNGEEFGKKVGVSKAQVSFWERGKGGASPASVQKIAELSGVSAQIVASLSDKQKASREEIDLHSSLEPVAQRAMASYGCRNRSELFASELSL